ncbi:BREX system P-loop protein BrxC [Bifidobacterium scaligerum]|uniref:BREX system P-loop protein BrxC n=1 Tax=Bifidobacterium scaligerum TaxID=2052656 RepID=A0A2M9HSV2_9BIFI|nr:BREX system P-loop protein BrxC [Bifidobacterium scaligerum]PJM79894.1 BREX system P-loop protein BrxC [Bifidobacterium scaligerum]
MSAGVTLKDIFAKNIEDKIDGVIKAGDNSHLADEVNEYVLTNEIQANLEQFLDVYNAPSADYTNGVWISGFFGSGKSHLLKMLSHILGDYPRNDAGGSGSQNADEQAASSMTRAQVIEIMKAKAREAENHELEALLDVNAHIPATSLLFNIDSKSQKGSNTALMDAFIRVFDEARGYYGANKYVAKMEHDLDSNGYLDEFKRQFEQVAGKPWSKGRAQAAFSGAKIDKAFAATTGDEVKDILKDYQKQYNPTIADFADDVNDWLQQKPTNYRLIFLVDEVGQFVGKNTDRMLNLQTITEELFSRTNGRAWVIVTSQEDIDAVIGDRNVSQGLDFTKIKGRFAVNLKLSSTDAIEVIQKRLLVKNETGDREVDALWNRHRDELDALFTFQGEGGVNSYSDRKFGTWDDFEATYPFVNYEFTLFRDAMRGMSAAGFFEGQHRSVGERSLLSTISSALADHKDDPVGNLIPFSALYDGIAGTIQSSVNHLINEAERSFDLETQKLALPLLKALLLVKHVEGFKANVRNLRILVFNRFDADLPQLEQNIRDTLDMLERKNYVHRTGDEYVYLTNDEQAVESEIKNLDIEDSQIIDCFSGMVNELVSPLQVQYETGKQKPTFHYGLMVDGSLRGRSYPITLHIVTPMDSSPTESKILRSAGARDSVCFILNANGSKLMQDVALLVRTEKYLRLHSNELGPRGRIIREKSSNRDVMRHELRIEVAHALCEATIAYNGSQLEVKSSQDAAVMVHQAMQTLIGRLYTNLSMVADLPAYADRDLATVLAHTSDDEATVSEANSVANRLDLPSQEIYDYVAGQQRMNTTPTVRGIVQHFEDMPYGWPLMSTLACLCHLYGGERIRLILDSNRVARTDAVAWLNNQKKRENIRVEIPKQYDAGKLRTLKEFADEYLDITPDRLSNDAEIMAQTIKESLREKAIQLEKLQAANGQFAFVAQLAGPLERLKSVASMPVSWLLETFPVDGENNSAEELLDDKDDVIDPIRKILHGMQRNTLVTGLEWIRANDSNFTLASDELQQERDEVSAIAADPQLYKGNKVNLFKTRLAELQQHLGDLVNTEREQALNVVGGIRENLKSIDSYRIAAEDAQQRAMRSLDDAATKITQAKYIADIRQTAETVENRLYLELINQLDAAKVQHEQTVVPTAQTSQQQSAAEEALARRITSEAQNAPKHFAQTESQQAKPEERTIRVAPPRPKPMLRTVDDVDEFLDEYRRKLVAVIKDGKRILL